MKVVYIAGKYGGQNYIEIDHNIALCRATAAWCAVNGIGFIAPHLNAAHFEAVTPEVSPAFWYEMDLRLLSDCDAILMLAGWVGSNGARREKAEAERLGLPVFYDAAIHPLKRGRDALLDWSRRP